MKKKIVVDARMVFATGHGIGSYIQTIAEGLEQKKKDDYEVIYLVSHSKHLPQCQTVTVNLPFLHFSEILGLPVVLYRLQADLFHSPSFMSLPYCPCPWVMTIHDLNHLVYGSVIQKRYYQFLVRRFARRARAIATVSKFSKKEIETWLGKNVEPIIYRVIDYRLYIFP